MKTLLTHKYTTVTIHHQDHDHVFKRHGGTLLLSDEDLEALSEPLALILVLLAGSRKFYIPKETYYVVRENIWHFLDRVGGGLNPAGHEEFRDDEAVLEAAKQHKAAVEALATDSPKEKGKERK